MFKAKSHILGVTAGMNAEGKQVRQKPLPTHKQPHFINAAKRAKYEAGEITLEAATKPVFIWAGASNIAVKAQINAHKYAQKKLMWQIERDMKEAAKNVEIKDVTDADV